MASVTLRGNQNATFGIASTVTFLFLEQIDQSNDPEFIADFKDQNGIQIGKAYGPTMFTATFSGTLQGGTPAVAGTVFSYDGFNYIIEKVTLTSKSNDYTKSTFEAKYYPGIPNP
jgi:hypothetical protein